MSDLEIEVCADPSRLPHLQDAWRALAAESSPYNQPDALALWWSHFGATDGRPFLLRRGFELAGAGGSIEALHVLVAHYHGEVRGILPLMRLRTRLAGTGRDARVLAFVGDPVFTPLPTVAGDAAAMDAFAIHLNGDPVWDGMLLAPVHSGFRALVESLERLGTRIGVGGALFPIYEVMFTGGWDRARVLKQLRHLQRASADTGEFSGLDALVGTLEQMSPVQFARACVNDLTPRLAAVLADRRRGRAEYRGIFGYLRRALTPAEPYAWRSVGLPADVDTFRAGFLRGERRKLLRRLQASGIRIDSTDVLGREDLARFIDLHRANHPRSVHLSPLTLEWYGAWLSRLAAQGALRWTVARSEGALVHAILHVRYEGRSSAVIMGREESAGRRFNLGLFCYAAAMEDAISQGCAHYDFRMGAEPLKDAFEPRVEPLLAFVAVRNGEPAESLLPRQWRRDPDPPALAQVCRVRDLLGALQEETPEIQANGAASELYRGSHDH